MNRKEIRELENRVRGPEGQTSPARDQQVLNALLCQYQENLNQVKTMEKIKMILCSRKIRTAVAVVIALVVLGGLWQGGSNEAWALEQILTALVQVQTIHVRGTMLLGEESEPQAFRLWAQAPAEDSGPLRMRYEWSDKVIILEGDRVYLCRPTSGFALLRNGPALEYLMPLYDAAKLGPWISHKMFNALQQVFADWEQAVAIDPETGREKISISCRYVPTSARFWATVDDETKLIDEGGFQGDSFFGKLKIRIDAQAFEYNQAIPPGAFTLPEGMMIIDEEARKKANPVLEEAAQLYLEKQYAKAIALCERICNDYPGLYGEAATAHGLRGHCYRALGQAEKAVGAYLNVIDMATEGGIHRSMMRLHLTQGYLFLGNAYMELGQDAKALEAFEACVHACESWPGPEEWLKWPQEDALKRIEQLKNP